MIVEHIIEPLSLVELAKSPRNCKDFEREFSKPSPRVIGNFPKFKKLRRLTYDAQSNDVSELEKLRLDELIAFICEKAKVNRSTLYDGTVSLDNNLLRVDGDCFEGVYFISDKRLDNALNAEIIYPSHFEQGIDSLPHQILLPKTVPLMCEKLGELLRLSQHIVLVDPYISVSSDIWKTVTGFMEHALLSSPVECKTFSIYFSLKGNRSKKGRCSCENQKNNLLKNHLNIIENYSKIEIFDIEENGNEGIHNRYIITELGAVSLPYGLNEKNENEFDDAVLLNEALYEKRYQQFFEVRAFDVVDSAVIE